MRQHPPAVLYQEAEKGIFRRSEPNLMAIARNGASGQVHHEIAVRKTETNPETPCLLPQGHRIRKATNSLDGDEIHVRQFGQELFVQRLFEKPL